MIDFDKMIDKHLEREFYPKKIGRYYPSEIGSCIRKVWYSYKHPLEVRPDLIKIFHLGSIIHDFIVEVLESEKTPEVELLETEVPFRMKVDDFIISGRVDDLILVKKDNKKILIEVKSSKDISYVKDAKPNNVIQLQFYMYATGVNDGILLYVDKRTLETKSFEIKMDPEMGQKIIERFRNLHNCLVENRLPEPEAKQKTSMNWMCDYCEYRDKCIKNEF